ncbi:MAG: dehydratase, partial [Solirubrobacterales bacterium]|nr:dehydratase [Solirubrobacterales bacterium]
AHGYLMLSLVAPMVEQLLTVTDAKMAVNYGVDIVRFPAPLPVGGQWRGGASIVHSREIPGGVQLKLAVTVEVEGAEKPSMVAEPLFLFYK